MNPKPLLNKTLDRVYVDSCPALQHFLTLSTRCLDTADDLVQEIYLRLPQLSPVPASEAAIRAWLFKVAANLAADYFRKEKRHAELLNVHFTTHTQIDLITPTPEKITVANDRLTQLQSALNGLPTVCANVLYLSRIEGLTHQAIAERLGISKSWVEKQLVRALDHLRNAMEDE